MIDRCRCGYPERACCDSVAWFRDPPGDGTIYPGPHQSCCYVAWLDGRADAAVLLIDDRTYHVGTVERLYQYGMSRRWAVRLRCVTGCDLTAATVFDVMDRAALADADWSALCPGLRSSTAGPGLDVTIEPGGWQEAASA